MKILKIDHLGIAVSSIDEKKNFWIDAMGLQMEGTETVKEQKVTTAFLPVGESEVELLESTSDDGPIAKYIEKIGSDPNDFGIEFVVGNYLYKASIYDGYFDDIGVSLSY